MYKHIARRQTGGPLKELSNSGPRKSAWKLQIFQQFMIYDQESPHEENKSAASTRPGKSAWKLQIFQQFMIYDQESPHEWDKQFMNYDQESPHEENKSAASTRPSKSAWPPIKLRYRDRTPPTSFGWCVREQHDSGVGQIVCDVASPEDGCFMSSRLTGRVPTNVMSVPWRSQFRSLV